jgi:nicotinamidase-related amidase
MHAFTLELSASAFVIIDVQEAFRQSITDFSEFARKIAVFTEGAKLLKLPILVTEQYPKGLGRTAEEIMQSLPMDVEVFEKTVFSAYGAAGFGEKLKSISARQIIVAGLEAHICVNQTVHDLLEQNFQVHLLSDCIASRAKENKQIALTKMQASGAILSSVEMALFELMRDSRNEQFKAIQKLIK